MSDTNSGYHEPNVPYRYTQKAQDERNWKKTLDNSNFTRTIGQKQNIVITMIVLIGLKNECKRNL